MGIDYFRRYVRLVRQTFSSLMMEVQPLFRVECAELKGLGLDGLLVYQETYHPPTYRRHHLRGQKQDFVWRLELDRLAQTGIDKIGLSWSNSCLTITARPKRWCRSLPEQGYGRCGKIGIRIWDV